MAGGEEKSRYELLEISDPLTLLVRGEFITNCFRLVGRRKPLLWFKCVEMLGHSHL